jgi:hypothetical protein
MFENLPVIVTSLIALLLAGCFVRGIDRYAHFISRKSDQLGWTLAPIPSQFIVLILFGNLSLVVGLLLPSGIEVLGWLWLITIVMGATSLRKLLASLKSNVAHSSGLVKFYLLLACVYFLTDFIYAATPFYRYDQWVYHLLVPKNIVLDRGLIGPIYKDHVFFTGIYEYLFIGLRSLVPSDLLLQMISNAVTPIYLVQLWFLFLKECLATTEKYQPADQMPLVFLGVICLYFAFPDHEIVTSAKVDALMAPLSAWLVLRLLRSFKSPIIHHQEWLIFCAVAVAGLCLKMTWLHFALSLAACILFFFAKGGRSVVRPCAIGVLLGLMLIAPYLIKNFVIFHNPLHPQQTISLFASTFYSQRIHDYWLFISGKATDINSYCSILLRLPVALLKLIGYLLPLGGLYFLLIWPKGKKIKHTEKKAFFMPTILLSALCCLWPLFYSHTIYARFLTPIFGIAAALFFMSLPSIDLRGRGGLYAIFLVPAFLNGSIEVSIHQIIKNSFKKPELFFAEGRGPLKEATFMAAINNDRHSRYDHPARRSAVTVTDLANGFYFDDLWITDDGYEAEIALRPYPQDILVACPELLLSDLHIRYFLAVNRDFDHFVEPWKALAKSPVLKVLDSSRDHIRYVDTLELEETLKYPRCHKPSL